VREIVPLPEIIPLEETPAYVVGVANLRGQIVPVIDLNLRFGHAPQPYRLEDCIVVLELGEIVIGILVNEVRNVRDVEPAERLPLPSYGADMPLDTQFLTGLLQTGEQIVMLLHLENLLRFSGELPALPEVENLPPVRTDPFLLMSARDRDILRERTLQLSQPVESGEGADSTPLVVVRLGDEYFGIALQSIREFSEVHSLTPIPCCPDHIVGLMNLRGDLITVLDIAGSLGLASMRAHADRKIIVLNRSDGGVGVLVDDVLDVLTLSEKAMLPALSTVHSGGEDHRHGMLPYGKRMVSLLDLPALLMQQNLIVNEIP
jgi:purine-binding chemotaxis protein CheW